MSFCFFKFFLNVDCPGCGLTHSIIALLQGHFEESLLYHPMGLLVMLWLLNFWPHHLLLICRIMGLKPPLAAQQVVGWWWRRFPMSRRGRNIVSHAVLFGFFAPWIIHEVFQI